MESIVQSIISYVQNENADYGVMINGEWGSGKTYYWEHSIKNIIEAIDKDGEKVKTIYISLYGINSLDEISKKIFIETYSSHNTFLNKVRKNKVGNAVPEIGKAILNGANLFGHSFGNIEIDYSKLYSLKNKVLCFDDLERANISITDVLGYINNFVEHDKIKVIIICNEKELSSKLSNKNIEMKSLIATYILDKEGVFSGNSKDNKTNKKIYELIDEKVQSIFDRTNEYKRIKEKLIGKTLKYVPDYNNIIKTILESYSNNNLKSFLNDNFFIIINTFYKSNTKNLRILKQALSDFEILYDNVCSDYRELKNYILQSLLIFTLSVSFEIKSGRTDINIFKNMNSYMEIQAFIATDRISGKRTESYLSKFFNSYYLGLNVECYFFKFAEVFISDGIFNRELFENNLNQMNNDIFKVNEPSYKKLLFGFYWDMSDEEFEVALREAMELIKKGQLHFTQYFRAFILLRYFSREGIIEEDLDTLKKIIHSGIELSSLNSQYCKDIGFTFMYDNINQDDDLLKLKNKIIDINSKLQEKMIIQNTDDLFKMLDNNLNEFLKKLTTEYCYISIFKNCDINYVFDKLILLSNADLLKFESAITIRYEQNYINLKDDAENLEKLALLIGEHLKSKPSCLSKILLKKLFESLQKICTTMMPT